MLVKRTEDEVSGQCCLDAEIRGLAVTDLSYHDDIRVLSEKGAQAVCEGHTRFGVCLCLVDAWNLILDRVFDGRNVDVRSVQGSEDTKERGRLT